MADLPQIPRYRIEGKIGSGGIADVFLGVQETLNREVAVKVLVPSLIRDPNLAKRFLREAETAAGLRHPNIVTIHDVGQYGETYYIVMEYLPESLKDRIKQRAIAPDEALGILRILAGALDYAHAKGFIHRDIKPDNIMFREDGTPVLVDFGIAKAVGSQTKLTATGMSVGTPHYMSPEQIRGLELDGRADIYSLGIVLYEMLTGRVPYDATDTIAVAIKHVQEPIPVLSSPLAIYQPLLEHLIAKDREARVRSGKELIGLIDSLEPAARSRKIIVEPQQPGNKFIPRTEPQSLRAPAAAARAEANNANKSSDMSNSRTQGLFQNSSPRRAFYVIGWLFILVIVLGIAQWLGQVLQTPEAKTTQIAEIPSPRQEANYSDYRKERDAEEKAWKFAAAKNTINSYRKYLEDHPSGHHTFTAQTNIDQLQKTEAQKKKALPAAAQAAKLKVDDDTYKKAESINTVSAYQFYLSNFPNGRHTAEAKQRINSFDSAGQPKANQGQAVSEEANYGPLNEIAINEFKSFLGLNYGDTVEKAYKVLGDPEKVDMSDKHNTGMWTADYPDFALWIDRNTRKIRGFYVKKLTNPANGSLHDEKTQYIGKSIDVLRSIFGTPNPDENDKKYFKDSLCYYTKYISLNIRQQSGIVSHFSVHWRYNGL